MRPVSLLCLLALLGGCASPDPGKTTDDTDDPGGEDVDMGVGAVPVPPVGPYGEHSFPVDAQTNWVNTGLYLHAGETAVITASGTWTVDGTEVSPEGDATLGTERGCPWGALVARSGLRFEDALTCIGTEATFTAPSDDIVYVGMVASTDLGETYGDRLRLSGTIEVTVSSAGQTVPTVAASALADYDFGAIESGWVELQSAHHIVTLPAAQVEVDRAEAAAGLETLDQIYEIEAELRGMTPFSGQRVRWFPDETITSFAYMLAGNPVRCDPDLLTGGDTQRILRAAEPETDIWGFAHELGHAFTMPNGTWVYMYVNGESWPNIFTLHALRGLDREAEQPNASTYCDDRDAYLAAPDYAWLRDDPFLQLCFLMDAEATWGADFYARFFEDMNTQTNEDLRYDGTDASIWRYVAERFTVAAGEDAAPLFEAWSVPLE